MLDAVLYLHRNISSLPSLRTMAVQTIEPLRRFRTQGSNEPLRFEPEKVWHKLWYVRELEDIFEGQAVIVLEAWVVIRADHVLSKSANDEMIRIRGTGGRRGKRHDDKTSFSMDTKEVAQLDGWNDCWRHMGTGFYYNITARNAV